MSQFYDQASLVMVPSGYKAGKVYSQKPLSTDGELTFTRNSNATRVNSSGLVERVRENVLTYSQAFENAAWTKSAAGTGIAPSVTANNATAPDGTLTADTIVFNAGAGTTSGDSSMLYQVITLSGLATASFYARVTSGTGQLIFRSVAGGTYTTANLTTTWQRFSAAENGSSGYFEIGIRRGLSNEPINASVTAELWAAQLETGDIATDYIATTSAAVSVGPTANVPRLDYSGGASCCSLLLESQRTNLATFSEAFDNSVWIAQNISTPTPNTAVSPDGYTNADTIEKAGGSGGTSFFYAYRSITSNTTNTFSIFAKYKEGSGIIWLLGKDSGHFAFFNLQTGTALSASGGMTTKIEAYSNGWYRCSFTQDYTGASAYTLGVGLCLVDGTPNYDATSAATQGAYIWGAQFEAGSYATSYIPTGGSGASVTRLADSASRTNIANLIGQTEGTLYWDFNVLPSTLTGSYYLQIALSDGTISNSLAASYYGSGRIQFAAFAGGSLVVNINLPSYGLTIGKHKFAFAYKLNDYVAYVDGALVGSDTSASVGAMSKLDLYDTSGGTNAVNQALLFKTRLSNADLANLTAL